MDDINLHGHMLTRQQQLNTEADQWRDQQLAKGNDSAKNSHSKSIYAPVLAKVGGVMVEVGSQLQAKYNKALDELSSVEQGEIKPARS